MTRLSVGISTCPNDTFAFHGLLEGRVDTPGLELDFVLLDVQELNERMAAGELDVAKASFFAGLRCTAERAVLPVGAALGFGVGPVLLASGRGHGEREPRVLAPGADTTAALLFALLHPELPAPRHVVFSEIMPALERGEADLGICIHEGRFTYRDHGLELVEDLGASWERETGAPVPLGGLFAKRALGPEVARAFTAALERSIAHGRAHRDEAAGTMRRHAQEHSDEVLWEHVRLYVTAETERLSDGGLRALRILDARARERGLVPRGAPPLDVLGPSGGDTVPGTGPAPPDPEVEGRR